MNQKVSLLLLCLSLSFFLPSNFTFAISPASVYERLQSKRLGTVFPTRIQQTRALEKRVPYQQPRWHYGETNRPKQGELKYESPSSHPAIQTINKWRTLFAPKRTPLVQNQILIFSNEKKQKEPLWDIDGTIQDVFDIGMRNKSQNTVFLQSIDLEIIGKTGLAENLEYFEGVLDGNQSFQIEKDGTMRLVFQNGRMASTETLHLEIGVRIKNPDITPRKAGSFKVRIKNVEFREELSNRLVSGVISGTSVSDSIGWSPSGAISTGGGNIIQVRSQSIDGRAISAGTDALVLKLNFEAESDDLWIREIIVHDTLSQGAVDNFIAGIKMFDEKTNQEVGKTRFINGQAHFSFSRGLPVYRNEQRSFVFEVMISPSIRTTKNQFQLKVDERDVIVSSGATGKELSSLQKYIDIESGIFSVVQSGGGVEISQKSLTDGFAVIPGTQTWVSTIQIQNNDSKDISIARITLDVFLSGLDFFQGRSPDDFGLFVVHRGQIRGESWIPSLRAGNLIQFDSLQEFFVPAGESVDLALKIQLEDLNNGHSKNDSVAINILGDENAEKDALDILRSGWSAFIWSDHSGRPHTIKSKDWMSGYSMKGLPTGLKVYFREKRADK